MAGATMCHMAAERGLNVFEIGRRLSARREELRLDQEAVAERARLSRAYISRLERGIVPNPKIGDLLQISDALQLSITDLVQPMSGEHRAIRIAECADLLSQLDGEPPEIVADIMSMLRLSIGLIHNRRLAREN